VKTKYQPGMVDTHSMTQFGRKLALIRKCKYTNSSIKIDHLPSAK